MTRPWLRKSKIPRKLSIAGMKFESEYDAIKNLFPDCKSKDIEEQIGRLEAEMTTEEAILYLFMNNPEQNRPVVYHDKEYPTKLELIKQIFPERDPRVTYYYLFDFTKKYNCSFEEAVDRELCLSSEFKIRKKKSSAGRNKTYAGEDSNGNKICPRCGGFLKIRSGRYGLFYGCSNYPNCRYTESCNV